MNMHRCLRFGLAIAFLWFFSPAPLRAEITLVERETSVYAEAHAGANADVPPILIVTDFLPASLQLSAATNDVSGASANADSTSDSTITPNSTDDTLVVTGSGTASGFAQRSPDDTVPATSRGGGQIMDLTFTLTTSYLYTATGDLSAASDNSSINGGAVVLLSDPNDPLSPIFNDSVNAFGESQSMSVLESGTLPPGTWRLRVINSFYVETGVAEEPGGSGSGSVANFEFTLAPVVPPPSLLLNISTRMQVGTEDNVLIGGFILTGNVPKKVILRAIGPSLVGAGLTGVLQNPTLELRDSAGLLVASNDDWQDTQAGEIIASTLQPSDDLESAIVETLPLGSYTVILSGSAAETGIGLVEVYDLDSDLDAKLANISTRGRVMTGDDVMIGGIIVGGGSGGANVIVRAIGPSLTAAGVNGALADPTLELHDGNGTVIGANDNWRDEQETEIVASSLAPNDDLESAILQTLLPGGYTAIVRGAGETTGVGLVEAYDID